MARDRTDRHVTRRRERTRTRQRDPSIGRGFVVKALGGGLAVVTGIALFIQVPENTIDEPFLPTNARKSRQLSKSQRESFLRRVDVAITSPITIELGGFRSVLPPQTKLDAPEEADFGSLNFELLTNDHDQRHIWDIRSFAPLPNLGKGQDAFSITDDDNLLQEEYLNGYLHIKKGHVEPTDCHYPKVEKLKYINCNNFHELGFERMVRSNMSKLVGHGEYKQVFTMSSPLDQFAFKEATIPEDDEDFTESSMAEYEMDGIVSAAVVPHPRMVDFYGYCALSQLNEVMDQGDIENIAVIYDRCEGNVTMSPDDPLVSFNTLTPIQKVIYALDMTEGVALLHNSRLGVIVHDDIQLSQFMVNARGRLQLNDFNRATIMMYSEQKGEYCKFKNGVGPGDWRAPEEYLNRPLDEKIDIFSLGNNFFSMLTGVYPIPDVCKYHQVAQRVKNGTRGFLDPRWKAQSYEEGKLVELIQMCWAQDPADRPTAGEVTSFLRGVVAHYLEDNGTPENATDTMAVPKPVEKDSDDDSR